MKGAREVQQHASGLAVTNKKDSRMASSHFYDTIVRMQSAQQDMASKICSFPS